MRGRFSGLVPYAALLGGAAYLYRESRHFAYAARPGELGPDFWPKAILALLMLVCAVELARRVLVAHPPQGALPGAGKPAVDAAAHEDRRRRYPHLLALGIGLTVGYVAVLQYAGFFVATAAYLGSFMFAGRYRRMRVIVATSVLGSLAFVFVFMKVVYVSLPLGIGPFQQLSVRLLAALGIH